jgi:MarR family transcriptional regulator, negative regulator of the multidrug operon emrRAB
MPSIGVGLCDLQAKRESWLSPIGEYARPASRRSRASVNSTALIEKRVAVTYSRYPDFPRDIVLLIRMIRQIARHTTSRANAILRTWDITYPEYIILVTLHGTETYTLSTAVLRDVTGEKAGNLARLTEQLCLKGLITRGCHKQDRRKAIFSLTPTGLQLIDDFLPVISALLDRWSQVLAEAEREGLERLLKIILQECEA